MIEASIGSVWSALADPWGEPIVRRALADLVLLSITAGVLGCWIVFYDLSYSAESLAHALFPGLVAAALLGLPLLVGGAAGLIVAAVAIALAGRTPEIGRDTAVAVVVTTLFGAGVVLALSRAAPPGLGNLLFGDVLGVSDLDLALAAALALAVVTSLGLLHGQLVAVGFDRLNATALGARPLVADVAVIVLVALAVLVAVQSLGNLLVVALLVGPAATARLIARRIAPMMALAVMLSLMAAIGGLYLSYYAGTAGGASVAAVVVALYLAVRALTGAGLLRVLVPSSM